MERLESPEFHVYYAPVEYPTEIQFRSTLHDLANCDHFVIDRRTRWVGMYVGFCIANSISFLTVDLPVRTYFGANAEFSRSDWREYSGQLGESTELAVAEEMEDREREETEKGIAVLHRPGVGRISVQVVPK